MKTSVVVTSIRAPSKALHLLSEGCLENGRDFIVIGDRTSPKDFQLDGCAFYGLEAQKNTGFQLATLAPEKSYARKNIGYLLAAQNGSKIILETDDDNCPWPEFWDPPIRKNVVPTAIHEGWINVYSFFSDKKIWPRGLPLDSIKLPTEMALTSMDVDSPIQQGLCDLSPDVDAIYRLLFDGAFCFHPPKRRSVAMDYGAWCPFNSQNTVWFKDAYSLMYLPATVTMRMTDIWRSFIAQRIAWENGWRITFHASTVYQERNEHDLMSDFALEMPGYLNNRAIGEKLMDLPIKSGAECIQENMLISYEEMIRNKWVGKKELRLLEAWFHDLTSI